MEYAPDQKFSTCENANCELAPEFPVWEIDGTGRNMFFGFVKQKPGFSIV